MDGACRSRLLRGSCQWVDLHGYHAVRHAAGRCSNEARAQVLGIGHPRVETDPVSEVRVGVEERLEGVELFHKLGRRHDPVTLSLRRQPKQVEHLANDEREPVRAVLKVIVHDIGELGGQSVEVVPATPVTGKWRVRRQLVEPLEVLLGWVERHEQMPGAHVEPVLKAVLVEALVRLLICRSCDAFRVEVNFLT